MFSYSFHWRLQDQDFFLDLSIPLNQDSDLQQDPDQDQDLDLDQRPDHGTDIDQHTYLDQELVPDSDIGTAVFRIRFIDDSKTKILP